MAILPVTKLNPFVRIVATASGRENVEKLEHAGLSSGYFDCECPRGRNSCNDHCVESVSR